MSPTPMTRISFKHTVPSAACLAFLGLAKSYVSPARSTN